MTPIAPGRLEEIASQLDRGIYPEVYNGGFVMPCEADVPENQGEVTKHVKHRQNTGRSKAGARHGAAGGQGPASTAPSLILTDLKTRYESQLDAVLEAYPKTLVWQQPEGLLLLAESALLPGLDQSAQFLVAVPYSSPWLVKGWGFWGVSPIGVEWIGPRHTNFPDGSICAFEYSDGTWTIGGSLVQLLDIYSVWALRHLHLKQRGRWPGYQAIHFAYERVLELRADEYCGCAHSERLYGECCQPNDKNRNLVADAVNFILQCHHGHRQPPQRVTDLVLTHANPPHITDLLVT